MFRYKMIRETGCCWVDSDILCLRKPDFAREDIVFGRQSEFRGRVRHQQRRAETAARRSDAERTRREGRERRRRRSDRGAIGPFLLTEIATRNGIDRYAREFFHFYPIEPDQLLEAVLARLSRRGRRGRARRDVPAPVERIDRAIGYDRSACPPAGSFLNEVFRRLGVIDRFARVYRGGRSRSPHGRLDRREGTGCERFSRGDRSDGKVFRSPARAGGWRACRGRPARPTLGKSTSNPERRRPKSTAWSALAA